MMKDVKDMICISVKRPQPLAYEGFCAPIRPLSQAMLIVSNSPCSLSHEPHSSFLIPSLLMLTRAACVLVHGVIHTVVLLSLWGRRERERER